MIRLLSSYALPILATALVLTATVAGFQTWRIGGLQADNGRLETQLDAAVGANQTNQQTIEALVKAAKANADKYAETLRQQQLSVDQINRLEQELSERAGDDIQTIQATDDACGHAPLPDDIRLRLASGSDQDSGSSGNTGTTGPG